MLAHDPHHAGALHLLGQIALAAGHAPEAATLIGRSVAADPSVPAAHGNLGVALAAAERHAEAAAAFRAALDRDPAYAPALLNLSASLLALGVNADALAAARAATALRPNDAAPRCNEAVALDRLGHHADAETAFNAALARDPDHVESLRGLASMRRRRGETLDRTVPLFRRATGCGDDVGDVVALAELHRAAGDPDAAADALAAAARRHGDHPLLRLAATTAPLVPLHRDDAARAASVAAYAERLDALDRWARAPVPGRLAAFADAIGRTGPFFLPYAVDDVRALAARFGRLAADALAARHGPPPPLPPPPAPGERVRLGVVCGFVRDHSVWKIPLRGWLAGLDPDRFAVTVYSTGDGEDGITAAARDVVSAFHGGSRSTAAWRARIAADQPHALLYPELGMNGAAFRLAALRLAPLQVAGPGHPVTTGLPTIDRFLSSALMEPPDADDHYTEQLERLPGLGFAWRPPPGGRVDAPPLPAGTRFFCGQSPFKYRPDDDALLVRIARAVPDARFVLIGGTGEAGVGEQLRARLDGAFRAAGLDGAAHLHAIGRVSAAGFAAIAGACDVVLDAPSWCGCNSTLEALATGTPVVTVPGATMRARHGAAILREVGVTEGIAPDRDGYVACAIAFGRDPALRDGIRSRLRALSPAMLDDGASAAALADILSPPRP